MAKNRPRELASHLGFWLRIVSNEASRAFASKLAATSVTGAEWAVLRDMYESAGESSPSAIADLTGLTRGAVSKLVERLLQKGLVTRDVEASDRRYQNVRLTPAARALVPDLGALADENDAEFFAVISDRERGQLAAILRKLARSHGLTTKSTR